MTKRLYQIPVPIADNDGKAYDKRRVTAFRRALLTICGGYTLLPPSQGAWQDEQTGQTFYDAVEPVQFACEPRYIETVLAALRREYPDQLCVMVAELGAVEFHDGLGRIAARSLLGAASPLEYGASLAAGRHDRGWRKE